nr:hypothetical protein [Tanacetum cinerariifolium]
DAVVDLGRRLPHQEQTTGDQDHVFPGEHLAEHFNHGLGQLNDPRHSGQQTQTQDQRHADTDTTRLGALMDRQLVGEDRDKDQ